MNLWKATDDTTQLRNNSDGVFLYASSILTLGLQWMGLYDTIQEGDGERIMAYWKFLLPVFKKTGRKNYSIEAFHIQLLRTSVREGSSTVGMVTGYQHLRTERM